MKYIISEIQYRKLLIAEQETEQNQTSSGFQYGKQSSSTTDSGTSSSGFEYGKQSSSSGNVVGSGSTTNSGTISVKIFNDKEEKKLAGTYIVKNMTKLPNNYLEVDLGSFKIQTDCGKLPKGDSSFKYGRSQLFSKDLATKVGEKFGCKFPS